MLTVRRKLVLFVDGDAEDILVKVLDVKLAAEVPLGVQGVVERSGGEGLRSHGHFTVTVTLPCRGTETNTGR